MTNPSSPSRHQESDIYFIGVDSDGTVFDSMEIKHKRVFQPLAVEIWGLESYEESFNEIAETINLYSVHRGVNRFQGLIMAFERLVARIPEAAEALRGMTDLRAFVLSGGRLSAQALQDYQSSHPSAFLDKVLSWTERSDQRYAQIMDEEGNPPYPSVVESLEEAAGQAGIAVISTSARNALLDDWGKADLLRLTTAVMGQESGSKADQLRSALPSGHPRSNALMMGDALGDLEAARMTEILFYPILPGQEAASWERFRTEALARFFEGTYAGEYEQTLLSDFEGVLQPDAPWPPAGPVPVCA